VASKRGKKRRPKKVVRQIQSDDFLESWEWTRLRYQTLKRYARRCMCCGSVPEDGVTIQVDHIKPRYTHPELALDPANLQVLCHLCNKGKAAWDDTDWRPATLLSVPPTDPLTLEFRAIVRGGAIL
jgi:5-methylcytosine-specific restriction endonuclease McrA